MHSMNEVRSHVKPRDSQRGKLYKADDVLKSFAEPLPTVKDVERFVRKVWALKRVHIAFLKATPPRSEPRVKDGRGTRIARGGNGHINIPLWARNSAVVLHELAHTITRREYGMAVPGHGWEYCGVFLKLVLYVMGREAHDTFKSSMKEFRVKFRPPRKREPLSPERYDRLCAVLADARARRSKD